MVKREGQVLNLLEGYMRPSTRGDILRVLPFNHITVAVDCSSGFSSKLTPRGGISITTVSSSNARQNIEYMKYILDPNSLLVDD